MRKKPQQLMEEDVTRPGKRQRRTLPQYVFLLLFANVCSTQSQLKKILTNQPGPINLFRFIVSPNDFDQSVEKLFYLSLLTRDGKCMLETKEARPRSVRVLSRIPLVLDIELDLIPSADICDQPSEDDYAQGLKKRQLVMKFDMTTWRVSSSSRQCAAG